MESKVILCRNCSAKIGYEPGDTRFDCHSCGSSFPVETFSSVSNEADYLKLVLEKQDFGPRLVVSEFTCNGCGAKVTVPENRITCTCPFCGNNIVVSGGSANEFLKPDSVLLYTVTREMAIECVRKWVRKTKFLPKNYFRFIDSENGLQGIWLPFWKFDIDLKCDYKGVRCNILKRKIKLQFNYKTETNMTFRETMTKTVEILRNHWYLHFKNCNSVPRAWRNQYIYMTQGKNAEILNSEEKFIESMQKNPQPYENRWTDVNGSLAMKFDDLLVSSSDTLDDTTHNILKPWDLSKLVPFNEQYLAGMIAEAYQTGLKDGFDHALKSLDLISPVIKAIGGDRQIINKSDLVYNDVRFRYILLPLWIINMKYKNRPYRLLINAQTGEVSGTRPKYYLRMIFWIAGAVVMLILAEIARKYFL